MKNVPFRQVITSFSGLRAHEDNDDFIIGEAEDSEGFFDAAGIESPGLSSAPAIGKYLAEAIAQKSGALEKEGWNGKRKGIVRPGTMSMEERAELIRKNPAYGTIICRCEGVSEGEIVDAINRTLGALITGWNQAACTPGHGPVPGRLLYAADHGDSCPREGA